MSRSIEAGKSDGSILIRDKSLDLLNCVDRRLIFVSLLVFLASLSIL